MTENPNAPEAPTITVPPLYAIVKNEPGGANRFINLRHGETDTNLGYVEETQADMQRSFPEYTYTIVQMAVRDQPAPVDDATVAALNHRIEELERINAGLNERVVRAEGQNRATVARVQAVLQEMVGEEPTWDATAYNDFVERVNSTIAWPFDAYEREYIVRGTATVSITMNIPVATRVTAANEEQAREVASEEDFSADIGDYLRYSLSGGEVYDAWNGDFDEFEADEVEED